MTIILKILSAAILTQINLDTLHIWHHVLVKEINYLVLYNE